MSASDQAAGERGRCCLFLSGDTKVIRNERPSKARCASLGHPTFKASEEVLAIRIGP